MSMIIELFGEDILSDSLSKVKEKIKALPPTQAERRSYLLHDWASITGYRLTQQDFIDVIGYNERQ